MASWAFTVIFSNRNIGPSVSTLSIQMSVAKRGWHLRQPPFLHSFGTPFGSLSLPRPSFAGGSRGHSRSVHVDLDLLRLRFLTLGNRQRQHAVLIIGPDRIGIHGIRKREAASKGAKRALHAQVVLFAHFLLELALPAYREKIVLHADVQILGIDIGEIHLHHEFLRGLVDVDGGRP